MKGGPLKTRVLNARLAMTPTLTAAVLSGRRWLPAVPLPPARVLAGPALLIALGLLAACQPAKTDDDAGDFPPVKVTAGINVEFPADNPQIQSIQLAQAEGVSEAGAQFTGHLVWDGDLTTPIYSPVAGRVEKVTAEIGQTVKPGDDLALMHSPDYAQAQADYYKAVSTLSQAQKALSRFQRLIQYGAAAVKDVESAQGDLDRATAEKQRAEATLQKLGETYGADLNNLYHLRSPLAGIVVDKKINLGQEVRSDIVLSGITDLATTPLFRISDPTHLWVEFDVPEAEIGRLKPGMPIRVRTSAYPGRPFPGQIEVVGASLDANTRVAYARGAVPNPEGLLKEEMYVTIHLELATQETQSVAVPSTAVMYLAGKFYVFVQSGTRKFTRQEVSVEHESDTGKTVVHGLSPGQWVVSQGAVLINALLAA